MNGPEDEVLDWDAVDWRRVEDDVRRLRQRIFTRACWSRLPGKRARPVLRGSRRGDASGLPDYWVVDVLQACGARVHLAHPLGSGGSTAGRPTVRKAQVPSGRRRTQEANADGRKATGNRQPHDSAPPPNGCRITGRIRA